MMQRRQILAGGGQIDQDGKVVKKEAELAFIDEEDDEEMAADKDIAGEVKKGEEANIVKIVVKNLLQKYQQDAKVLKKAKGILK